MVFYVRFRANLCLQFSIEKLPGVGHYLSRTRPNAGVQTAATIQVISWANIEVRLGVKATLVTTRKS